MTVESVGDEDGCNGDCCTGPGRWPTRPANAYRVRPIPPLPARTRARLAAHRRITRIGLWLCDHGHPETAERIWRACHMV